MSLIYFVSQHIYYVFKHIHFEGQHIYFDVSEGDVAELKFILDQTVGFRSVKQLIICLNSDFIILIIHFFLALCVYFMISNIYKVVISVCLLACSIITQEPLDAFAFDFVWKTAEKRKLSLFKNNSKLSGLNFIEKF